MCTEVLMSQEDEAAEDIGETEGRYANYFKVGHNAFEFLLDFGHSNLCESSVRNPPGVHRWV